MIIKIWQESEKPGMVIEKYFEIPIDAIEIWVDKTVKHYTDEVKYKTSDDEWHDAPWAGGKEIERPIAFG